MIAIEREKLEQVLEALENHCGNYKLDDEGVKRYIAACKAIEEALAQPEQEPVGFAVMECPWVGLTDEEMYEAVRPLCKADSVARSLLEVSTDEYRAIEAKLKEKNT